MTMINIADLRDPDDPSGRSYRQINNERQHMIPIGSLVELHNGVRLFVVHHDRDCDGTPLYYLSASYTDTEVEEPGFRNRSWYGGYADYSLKVIDQ